MKRQRPDGSDFDDNDNDNVTAGASSTLPTDHIPQLQQPPPQILPSIQTPFQLPELPMQQLLLRPSTPLLQDIPVLVTPIQPQPTTTTMSTQLLQKTLTSTTLLPLQQTIPQQAPLAPQVSVSLLLSTATSR